MTAGHLVLRALAAPANAMALSACRGSSTWIVAACAGVVAAWPAAASAHVGGGAFILLLPTHLYVAGGAIVVAASFALVALVPSRLFARLEALSLRWAAVD